MIKKIEKVLDEQIRPALASHGGNIEVIELLFHISNKYNALCMGCFPKCLKR